MSSITDEIVEAGARVIADVIYTDDPVEWAYYADDARAVITAVAPLIRAAALEEAANAADAAVEHCRISAERAEANGSTLGALLSAYGQECIQAVASSIRDHTNESYKAPYLEADKITELRSELLFADKLSERQAALLTEVVDALRGDPPPGVRWSHHDAGELAKAATAEIERLRHWLSWAVRRIEPGLRQYIPRDLVENKDRGDE